VAASYSDPSHPKGSIYNSMLRLNSRSSTVYVTCSDDKDKNKAGNIEQTDSQCENCHPSASDDVCIHRVSINSEEDEGINKIRLPSIESTEPITNSHTCLPDEDSSRKHVCQYKPIIDDDIDDMSSEEFN
jgi:hypothetical protein